MFTSMYLADLGGELFSMIGQAADC